MTIDVWMQHPTQRLLRSELGLGEQSRRDVVHGNAERVFKLPAPPQDPREMHPGKADR
ncbi:hypothetical protein Mkiyose1088_53680 [Mycobacterium kiyosense]|uniref:Uncharacterized protein n=1 Tax=Mycobacterium kiyosense TaxID=2871094 RepID=A0AA37V887_9MYCO|nr:MULTISPECIES: hypothetical protein [Mycobacterium]GLB86884.1 hypothetical protein SRL2020028_61400 [Mycobacterium kiyosense]GLD03502.1 hypothetical protein Mkiyose1088_53680 [Mycobacterium kiyosense]GLD39471.1 hypothetical protein Mkiyose1595_56910 [Mycobacterium kiyosense]